MKTNDINKGQAGFSLTELLIASVILLFVIGLMSSIVAAVQAGSRQQRIRSEAYSDATAAMDSIARLIRTAGNNPNGISGLVAVDPETAVSGVYHSIHIRSDWRGSASMSSLPDGDTNDPFEDVRFYVANNKLMKLEPSDTSGVEFLDNISDIQFIYYDTNNALIADPASAPGSISRIDILVTVQPQYSTSFAFRTSAYMRLR